MYFVLRLKKTARIGVGDDEIELPLELADGMIGALPVFETREAAKRYAAGALFFEIQAEEEDNEDSTDSTDPSND